MPTVFRWNIARREQLGTRRMLDSAARYRPSSLRGVSMPYWFWSHRGNSKTKVSRENPPAGWRDPETAHPPSGEDFTEALRVAVALGGGLQDYRRTSPGK